MKHFEWYKFNVLHNAEKIIIGMSYYNSYPFTVIRSDKMLTIIEGTIYNKSVKRIRKDLDEISFELSSNKLLDNIRKFVLDTNGEFIVIKYDKQREKLIIFNDAFGRLPFYLFSSPRRYTIMLILSREVKFITPFIKKRNFDKFGLAEYLLFGYPLGNRTLWKDVKRLPPAAFLMVNIKDQKKYLKKVFSWNLDPEVESKETRKNLYEETKKLRYLFLTSLRDITQKFSKSYTHVVSLSGGLDSRATLAGLIDIGSKPTAYSFSSSENRIAGEIAQRLKVKHHTISLSYCISDKSYVDLTDGLLDLGLRSRVSYLDSIRRELGGKVILYTGDGGDKTLAPSGFKGDISKVQRLLQYIIETEHVLKLDEISNILDINKNTFRKHLYNHIMEYPEKTMEGKFTHFKVFERGFKWLFVGEDRNRIFLWSTTPFYSIPFFKNAIKIPQRIKEHYILYKKFLSNLNPILCQIRYYDRLIPLSIPDWLLKIYLMSFELFKTRFYELGTANPIIKAINILMGKASHETPVEIKKLILSLLAQKRTYKPINSSRISNMLVKENNNSRLNILATLILYMSIARPKKCSINQNCMDG
jgi:asparagine synthase (glutamine-hydrolysing)